MLTGELIPMCRRRGLGRDRIGVMGISTGGYGALLLAEKRPDLIAAVAAISPAIWTSYPQARSANEPPSLAFLATHLTRAPLL